MTMLPLADLPEVPNEIHFLKLYFPLKKHKNTTNGYQEQSVLTFQEGDIGCFSKHFDEFVGIWAWNLDSKYCQGPD